MARVHALRALPDEVSRSLVDVSYPSLPATENGGLLFSFHDEPALLESCAASLLPFEMTAGSAPVAHLHWLLRCDTEEERALRMQTKVAMQSGGGDAASLATVLQRMGLSAALRTSAGNKLRSLRHEFVVVASTDTCETGLTFIIDPAFRDQFAVAHPTPRFAAILNALPQELVATPATVSQVVTLVSREMARSFADQRHDLPPWRSTCAMLSRWQLPQSPAGAPLLGLAFHGTKAAAPGGAEHADKAGVP